MKVRRWPIGLLRLSVAACAVMTLGACGAGGIHLPSQQIYPPDVYEQRVSTNDVSIYWRCTPASDSVRFEGVVQNIMGSRVKFMELELAGADGRGRYVSSATTALADINLQTSQISPFSIELRPSAGALRFDLFYQYELDSAIGGDTRPHLRALDVCSPMQHRLRK